MEKKVGFQTPITKLVYMVFLNVKTMFGSWKFERKCERKKIKRNNARKEKKNYIHLRYLIIKNNKIVFLKY